MIPSTHEHPAPTHEEIALHAFFAWEKDGCPQGRDQEYWLAAEAALRASRTALAQVPQPVAPAPRGIKPKTTVTRTTRSIKPATARRKA